MYWRTHCCPSKREEPPRGRRGAARRTVSRSSRSQTPSPSLLARGPHLNPRGSTRREKPYPPEGLDRLPRGSVSWELRAWWFSEVGARERGPGCSGPLSSQRLGLSPTVWPWPYRKLPASSWITAVPAPVAGILPASSWRRIEPVPRRMKDAWACVQRVTSPRRLVMAAIYLAAPTVILQCIHSRLG